MEKYNLVLACYECNIKRNTMLLEDFQSKLFKQSKLSKL